MKNIDILMATYNGGKYLEKQLDSIFNQTYTDFRLLIRDDGSTDNTIGIIEEWQKKFPGQIDLLADEKKRLRASLSFGELLSATTANYIMLCDQDDVWLENKIQVTFERMKEAERQFDEQPILVFTDLTEVDENMNVINKSFIKSQLLYPERCNSAITLLALNVVAGCTSMINKRALKYILPIKSTNIIHDHWMAVNIAHYGRIIYMPIPTILYRQHTLNAVGANDVGINYFLKKAAAPGKQFKVYYNFIKDLDFKINIFQFVFYKIYFTIKRLSV